MPAYNPNDFSPMSGKEINSQGNVVTPADGVDTSGNQGVNINGRKQTTIQTHTNQTIASNSWSTSSWFDANGFDKLALTLKNDAATSTIINLNWSNDGVTQHGTENIGTSNTSQTRAMITDTKARYFNVAVQNTDTISHVINVWVFLKD